jgi:aminocarboxymuconate-semialdehyde decarboxylase
MQVIDVHCHIVPAEFPAAPPSCSAEQWPTMDHRANNQAAVMIGGKEFRLIDSRCWDTARRIADMNDEDVGTQVISPMPELLSYWLAPQATLAMSRFMNQSIAEIARRQPDRFLGMGMVPLQDPELAAKELASLRDDYGLVAVEIGSNIGKKSPGEAFFDPFFAEAERLGLAVFVHALHPTMTDRLVGPAMIAPYIAFPTDVGLAAASCITGRVLEKFPKLRLGFSHSGGTLASFLPRLESGWQKLPVLNKAFASPSETARKLYYDNLAFDHRLLAHLVETFGYTQIFAGSDYPFGAGQKAPGKIFDQLDLSAEQRDALRGGNAARFLNLNSESISGGTTP